MMTRTQKAQEITEISRRLGKAKAAFLVDFSGVNVEEITVLRRSLYPIQAEMRVVKNTLARRAIKDHPEIDACLSKHFTGVNAIVFAYDDVSLLAKRLIKFREEVSQWVVKTGVMEGRGLDKDQVQYLADLPSKQELQAKLLATLQAPASKFLRLLEGVPEGFVRLLGAYRDSKK